MGLLVIDVQRRLVPAMHEFGPALRNMQRLIRGFELLGAPVAVTEQYPRGLGPTIPSIARLVAPPYHEKLSFGCFGCESLAAAVAGWESLVLCGIEAHVCVLQTALQGLARSLPVTIAADAVTSRQAATKALALRQAAAAGAVVAATESILFERLGVAGTETFRQVSRLVR